MNPVYDAKIWARGTRSDPIPITHEEYAEIRGWVLPLDAKLESLPKEKQEDFIKECRREAAKRWPWWFPNVHVYIS